MRLSIYREVQTDRQTVRQTYFRIYNMNMFFFLKKGEKRNAIKIIGTNYCSAYIRKMVFASLSYRRTPRVCGSLKGVYTALSIAELARDQRVSLAKTSQETRPITIISSQMKLSPTELSQIN